MTEQLPPDTPLAIGVNRLFAELKHQYGLRFDADLARLLVVSKPMISRLRSGQSNVTPAFILRVHEITGMPVARIRELSGVRPEWDD